MGLCSAFLVTAEDGTFGSEISFFVEDDQAVRKRNVMKLDSIPENQRPEGMDDGIAVR